MPARTLVRHPVWCVTWLDASDAFPVWSDRIRPNEREQEVQSVGYLVDDGDEDWLTLATSCVESEDGVTSWGGGIHILRANVVKMRKLAA